MFAILETDERHIVGMVKVCSTYKCPSHKWEPIPEDHKFKEWSSKIVRDRGVKQFLSKKGEFNIFSEEETA